MRILVTTTGFPGHVLPLMPFARAAREAGHEVCVAGPPPAAAIAHEFEFCEVGRPPQGEVAELLAEAALRSPEAGHSLVIAEGFGRLATRAALPDLLQLVGAWRPDVVLRESQEFAGALAAERHCIPHVRVALGLASTEMVTVEVVAAGLDELRAELDLAADPEGERLLGESCFTFLPEALDGIDGSAFRFREQGRPRPAPDLEDPLVYVTFGSVAASRGYFPELYRDACTAVASLGVRVHVTVGADVDPAELGPLPVNVKAERWVPQDRIAARAAAVVSHGGYGSMLGALTYGLPQVVLPLFAGDQWHNARRVAEIGAGICVAGPRRAMFDRPAADELAALPGAVARVLKEPSFRDAARRVADEIAALPPVSTAPGLLPQLTKSHIGG